jgi:hypothetical protein
MTKLIALAFVALSLTACSSMYGGKSSMGSGNMNETKNSSDANKSGNTAAQSPGTGGATK